MRHTAELAARAAAWLARPLTNTPDGKRSAEGLLELASVWAAIQNVPLPACIRQCQYSERARDVAAYVREFSQLSLSSTSAVMDAQTTSNYQLAPAYAGQTFVHEDWGKAVTADNLTDEDAKFFIGKGRTDAFIKRTASTDTETPVEGGTTEVTPNKPLVPEADLTAEKDAHAATKQKGADALKAEKDAHKQTKKELGEATKQVADLTKQLEKLTKQVEKAADSIAEATQPETDATE